jgi:hypothetical protein
MAGEKLLAGLVVMTASDSASGGLQALVLAPRAPLFSAGSSTVLHRSAAEADAGDETLVANNRA